MILTYWFFVFLEHQQKEIFFLMLSSTVCLSHN